MDTLLHQRTEPTSLLFSLLRKTNNIRGRILFVVCIIFIFIISIQNTWAESDLLGALYLKQCVYSADCIIDNESSLLIKCCSKELDYCVVCPKDQTTKCSIYHDINTLENLPSVINKKDVASEEKTAEDSPSIFISDSKNKNNSEINSINTTAHSTTDSLEHQPHPHP